MTVNATTLRSTVLCLDDDETVLELLKAFLPRQGPFEVRTTTDLDCGFELVVGGTADLVVCDYEMGTCSGIDFLERVREYDDELPFVLFTGHGTEELFDAARSAGATALVRKGGPERLDALAARLSAASEETRGGSYCRL